jgi:putative hydrolase of the HAD superfamily
VLDPTVSKPISFDPDGRLWDFETVMGLSTSLALEELAEHDPIAASQWDVDRVISVRDRIANEWNSSVISFKLVRFEGFKQALIEAGRPNDDLAEHINKTYLHHRYANIVPYDDVLPTLTVLRERYKIGALTNGNSYLERVGMGQLFDFAVLTSELGVSKPDLGIFHIAADMAGYRVDELLHVGGSLVDEVIGASDVGARAVCFNRIGIAASPEHMSDFQIISLSTLIDWLIG